MRNHPSPEAPTPHLHADQQRCSRAYKSPLRSPARLGELAGCSLKITRGYDCYYILLQTSHQCTPTVPELISPCRVHTVRFHRGGSPAVRGWGGKAGACSAHTPSVPPWERDHPPAPPPPILTWASPCPSGQPGAGLQGFLAPIQCYNYYHVLGGLYKS